MSRSVAFAAKLEALASVYQAAFEDSDIALFHCLSIFDIAARSETSSRETWKTHPEQQLGIGALERVLSLVAEPDPEVLNSFVAILHPLEQRSSFRDELILIRLGLMGSHESVLKNGPPVMFGLTTDRGRIREPRWEPRIHWLLGGAIRSSEARGIQWINEIIGFSDSPSKAISAAEELAARIKSLRTDWTWSEYISKVMHGSFDMLPAELRRAARRTADLRCTRTALAVERFRLANAQWPETLDVLVPEYLEAVPLDPFDEKPLRYKIEPDKITVYSIHENETDNDGTINDSPRWSSPSPDVGFRLLNPDLRGLRVEHSTGTNDDVAHDSSANQP
jgi:hypothetical protein